MNMPLPGFGRTILVVASQDEDYRGLRHMLSQSNWRSEWTPTCGEALMLLDKESIPIVICEHSLPDGEWRDVLSETSLKPDPPIVIVAVAAISPLQFEEVHESGGYDVLVRPFESYEVLEVLANARRTWCQGVQRIGHG